MPKLVAFYLREFSVNAAREPSILYKFVFCLCLPFFSQTFRTARLHALAIAECTNSADQIVRLLNKLTGATAVVTNVADEYSVAFSGADVSDFAFNNAADAPLVTFGAAANNVNITVMLNGAETSTVAAYLELLIPFYIRTTINYQ